MMHPEMKKAAMGAPALEIEVGDADAGAEEKPGGGDAEGAALIKAIQAGNGARVKEIIRGIVEDCMSEGDSGEY